MSTATIIDALALPANARLDQRIPKKLLAEQGAPTAADKRQIQDGIEELLWVAALKPTNIGVPMFRSAEREYVEVAVLAVAFRIKAKAARLTELIHRAVPYPVLLVASSMEPEGGAVTLSAAHKRFAQNEAGKVVVEDLFITGTLGARAVETEATVRDFLATLALSGLPTRDLFALYQGWIDRIVGFLAAGITGRYAPPDSAEQSSAIRDGIAAHARLSAELSTLRVQAAKETQMNRRVDLNLEIKRLEGDLAAARKSL